MAEKELKDLSFEEILELIAHGAGINERGYGPDHALRRYFESSKQSKHVRLGDKTNYAVYCLGKKFLNEKNALIEDMDLCAQEIELCKQEIQLSEISVQKNSLLVEKYAKKPKKQAVYQATVENEQKSIEENKEKITANNNKIVSEKVKLEEVQNKIDILVDFSVEYGVYSDYQGNHLSFSRFEQKELQLEGFKEWAETICERCDQAFDKELKAYEKEGKEREEEIEHREREEVERQAKEEQEREETAAREKSERKQRLNEGIKKF